MWFLFCTSSCFESYESIPLKLKRKDCSSGFYATKAWMSRDHISWHVDLQSCTARSSLLWREETRWRRLKTVFLWAREKEYTYQTHIFSVLVSKLRLLRSCFILSGCFNKRNIESKTNDGRLIRAHWKDDLPSFNKKFRTLRNHEGDVNRGTSKKQ